MENVNHKLSPELFAAMRTELTAQKIMSGPNDDQKRFWNLAIDRAINCLVSYRDGFGLFQMMPDTSSPKTKQN